MAIGVSSPMVLRIPLANPSISSISFSWFEYRSLRKIDDYFLILFYFLIYHSPV